MDEVEYFAQEQWGHDYDELFKELQKLNEGRNLDCWPIISFGWKDADLDPNGCTGIKSIIAINDEYITLEIGGHKTFCPFEDWDDKYTEEQLEDVSLIEQETINEIPYPGDWSGDDWIIYTEDEIEVAWVLDEATLFPNYEQTAKNIVEEATRELSDFENTMAEYSKYFETIVPDDSE